MLTVRAAMEQALAAYARGAWREAEDVCRAIVGQHAAFGPALHLLGVIAGQTQRAREAVELLRRAVAADPRNPEALHHLGVALSAMKRYDDALGAYARALELQPDHADAHYNCGVACLALARPDAALQSLQRAIALRPAFASAHLYRAMALSQFGRHHEALAAADRALELEPQRAQALIARGKALRDLHRPAAALECSERALALAPELAEGWNNRGNALADLGEFTRAIESYDRAIALRPDYADAHFNASLCLLVDGDLERGWQEYEWRPRSGPPPDPRRACAPVRLRERTVAGRTILLHAEQGLGDTLQFCRYAPRVAAMGATVVLEVQPALRSLLARMPGVSQVLSTGGERPPVDVEFALLSLPLAFATTLATVPASVPYLDADPARRQAWRARLPARRKTRIGIAWSGNARQERDHLRSMRLLDALPLLDTPHEYVSLQKELRADDAELLAARPELRHFGHELHDFDDTAALVAEVDVVVTVDTSVAHLAGAMGKPTFIMLAWNADWRWLRAREDCPWYPTARLVRQPRPGDWASVVERVRTALQTVVSFSATDTRRGAPRG